MKEKHRYFITKSVFVFILFTLDQAAKFYIIDYFKAFKQPLERINEYFNLVLVWNKGISFGMLNHYANSNIIFLVISLIITSFMVHLLIKSKGALESISYVLIIGGALGNIFDRIERGAVTDFIEVHYANYYWPAFNIADSIICIGVFLMIVSLLFMEKNNEDK